MTLRDSTGTSSGQLPGAPLLLTAREAARLLSISPRTLWTLTNRGELPAVRIGRAIRYDPVDLRHWIERQKQK
jgi:excisionase family DNA binding protein